MKSFREKIITQLPLTQLWNADGPLPAQKLKDLDAEETKALLDECQLIIADVGEPLQWIEKSTNYQRWKEELKTHICSDPDGCSLEDFPGHYFYFASLWSDNFIVLQVYH